MTDFLRLPYLRTLDVADCGEHYKVHAEGAAVPTACPACQSPLYRHGSQLQNYLDTPMHGKQVLIEIDRKRYRCKACGKTLFEPLGAMDSKRLATTRLIQHIERHCLRKTFSELSREVGVDDKTRRDTRTTVRKKTRKAVQQPSAWGLANGMGMARMTFPQTSYKDTVEESVIEYGPYIPTLVKKLEAGDFA